MDFQNQNLVLIHLFFGLRNYYFLENLFHRIQHLFQMARPKSQDFQEELQIQMSLQPLMLLQYIHYYKDLKIFELKMRSLNLLLMNQLLLLFRHLRFL